MLNAMTTMLICADVQKSIKFYEDALGFKVANRMDEVGKTGWAMLERDNVTVMLASPTYLPDMPKVDGRYYQAMYYIYTDDLEAERKRVIETGVEATEIVERFYNMKEFELVDPDGHMLVFGQEVPEGEEGEFRV